jgi:hypothetical protein
MVDDDNAVIKSNIRILFGRNVGDGRKQRDYRFNELAVRREKEIRYDVGINGRKESLGNEGDPTSIDGRTSNPAILLRWKIFQDQNLLKKI